MGPGRDVPTERSLQYPSLREFSENILKNQTFPLSLTIGTNKIMKKDIEVKKKKIKIEREWAMPNSRTFKIKPIKLKENHQD